MSLPNPGFEVDVAGWLRQSTSTATLTRDTTKAHSGAASGRWDTTAATYLSTGTNDFPAVPGTRYSVSVWLTGAGPCAVGVVFLDAASAVLGAPATGPDTALSGAFARLSASAVAPAGAAWVRLRIYQRTATASSVWVDDADIRPVTTLTATVLEDLAAVRLEVAGADAGAVPISRLDRRGASLVRQLPDQESSAGLLSVVDYEPPLAGLVRYELDGVDDLGDPFTVTAEVDLGGAGRPVVTVPLRPAIRADLAGDSDMIDYDATRTSRSVRHQILGTSDDVVILRPMSLRAGTVTFRLEDHDTAAQVEEVLSAAEVVLIRQAPFAGLDLYATVDQVRVAPIHDDLDVLPWSVTATYAETSAPAGGLLGAAGWTVADVVALGVTVGDIPALFPTVYDLAVGPR